MRRTAGIWAIILFLFAAAPCAARAQDFYGEGNVLIAVDMGAYAENDDVRYPEGTLGTLRWDADAPRGVSTRPVFAPHVYAVSPDVTPVEAPAYALEHTYTVGQTFFLPYSRTDDPEYKGMDWLSADAFPQEVFDAGGAPRFSIHSSRVKTENGVTLYKVYCEQTADGARYPCIDFLEIECVAITAYSTVWQYTGRVCSARTGFEMADYVGAVNLSDAEIEYFRGTCDDAYTTQARVYGDPHWEDARGDRDGKAAYVALDFSIIDPKTSAYYDPRNTEFFGFDCLVIGVGNLPERRANIIWEKEENYFAGILIHELNHYIVNGCISHGSSRWNMWVGEAFAQSAIYAVRPESIAYLEYLPTIAIDSSRQQLISGMIWKYGELADYPNRKMTPYTLGPFFLRYIERETTGKTDGRLWTYYFAQRTPVGSITATELDGYLTAVTGEGLDAWTARFMAEVVARAGDGTRFAGAEVIPPEYRVDPYLFFRPYEDYGKKLSFAETADETLLYVFESNQNFTAVQGGGTTYAWRNDKGGRIAVTGADERWYFFAVDIDLPAADAVVEIDSAEELARIGHDPRYPIGGRYRLTADLDLGDAASPWSPIGTSDMPFIGEFDGNGHAVRLYVDAPNSVQQGLFGCIEGNALIQNLTVHGSVRGREQIGGIIGRAYGGTIRGCICDAAVTSTAGQHCGGIAGAIFFGTVENCAVSGTITGNETTAGIVGYTNDSVLKECRFEGSVTGNLLVAGIVGQGNGCAVSACWQTGTVSGKERVGGIAGQIQFGGSLQNCYSAGTVSGGEYTGGVAGRAAYTEVVNCYSYQSGLPTVGSILDSTVTACCARSDTASGTGFLTTAQFCLPESFDGWDFDAVWTLANGVRPVLRSNTESFAPQSNGGSGGGSSARDASVQPPPAMAAEAAAPVTTEQLLERFNDLAADAWYLEPVRCMVERGIMNGVGDGGFAPDAAASRAMIAQLLFNLDGAEASGNVAAFDDVSAESWYADAVTWMVENGLARGEGERFGADDDVTREQLAVMLFRYAGYRGLDTSARGDVSAFGDAENISAYARDAMAWAVGVGLVNGAADDGGLALNAGGGATRAQVAAMMQRFCETILR